MAVCIKCGKDILYGCDRCMIFSDTMIHVDCLRPISVVSGKYTWSTFSSDNVSGDLRAGMEIMVLYIQNDMLWRYVLACGHND